MTPTQLIQKEIDESIAHLNELDTDGEEVYSHYRDELQYKEDKSETIADLIQNADLDNTDFNIGFEQGYLRGLEVALSLLK